MKVNGKKHLSWLGLSLALVLAACGGSAVPPGASPSAAGSGAAAQGTLQGAGSTFDFPLFSKVFDAYQKQSGVKVNYQSVGSGAGIQQLTKKTIDFGASDAPLNAEQQKAAEAAGGPVLHLPITLGAVAVGYNLPIKNLKLDGPTLADIYLGTVTKWNDPRIASLNPGVKLPNTAIAVVHRSDGSGTTFIFTAYLSAVSPQWKSKVGNSIAVSWPVGIGGKGSEGVSGQVNNVAGGIGYFELSYAKQNSINTALIKNEAGKFLAPSVSGATAAAASAANHMPADLKAVFVNAPGAASYPISGFSWIVVYKNQPNAAKGKELVKLLTYVVTTGQSFSQALYYAPLPDTVRKLDEKAIASIRVGAASASPSA